MSASGQTPPDPPSPPPAAGAADGPTPARPAAEADPAAAPLLADAQVKFDSKAEVSSETFKNLDAVAFLAKAVSGAPGQNFINIIIATDSSRIGAVGGRFEDGVTLNPSGSGGGLPAGRGLVRFSRHMALSLCEGLTEAYVDDVAHELAAGFEQQSGERDAAECWDEGWPDLRPLGASWAASDGAGVAVPRLAYANPGGGARSLIGLWRAAAGPRNWKRNFTTLLMEWANRSEGHLQAIAGRAAAALATLDFDFVNDAIFRKWLRAETTVPLNALDAAFTIYCSEGRAQEALVVAEAHRWRNGEDGADGLYGLCWLAAGEFGATRLEWSFETLTRMIESGRRNVAGGVSRGLLKLIRRSLQDGAEETLAPRLIAALRAAVPQNRPQNMRRNRMEAIRAARDWIVLCALVSREDDNAAEAPLLARLAQRRPDLSLAIAELIEAAACGPYSASVVRAVRRSVYIAAERNDLHVEPAAALARALTDPALGNGANANWRREILQWVQLADWRSEARAAFARLTPALGL